MANSFIVRYGSMRSIGEFSCRPSDEYLRNQEILVRTDRGIEWGEVLSEASEMTRKYLNSKKSAGRILRVADEQDLKSRDELDHKERSEFTRCGDMITERKLQMQLVDVEHVFGGERIIFYYLAENRVDFRELVEDLRARIQYTDRVLKCGRSAFGMKPKLLADYGDCGKAGLLCDTHLNRDASLSP